MAKSILNFHFYYWNPSLSGKGGYLMELVVVEVLHRRVELEEVVHLALELVV